MDELRFSIFQQDYFLSEQMNLGLYEIISFTSKCPTKKTEPNEDAIGILPLDDGSIVLAIADGAGGYPSGEKTSYLAVQTLLDKVSELSSNKEKLRDAVIEGIESANVKIIDANLGGRTTLTVCTLNEDKSRFYQIGDSGALISGQKGALIFETLQQSPVGYGVEAGLIHEDEALSHPQLNQVNNLMGEANMSIHIGPIIALKIYDTLLMATDGILDNFSKSELIEIIRKGTLEEVISALTQIFLPEHKDKLRKNDDYSFILCRLNKNT
ncbi:MAG: protein phosphatase 2C domain-containing protein [Bdellovibrionales bacterium]|nr:protein phosphatase 2C domain-containing protein [Bdellovibrionales bacterium]